MIPGLTLINEFITREEEEELIRGIDSREWENDISRRYGYKFNYRLRRVSEQVEPLPPFLNPFIEKLEKANLLKVLPDQVIINEYSPGQGIIGFILNEGIGPHIDTVGDWGDEVVSLSLLSPCVMNFIPLDKDLLEGDESEDNRIWRSKKSVDVFLEPRSIVVLKEDSRYQWKHGIQALKEDLVNGKVIQRGRRVSLSFRKFIGTHDLS